MSEPVLRRAASSDGPALRTLVASVLAEYGLSSDPEGTDADLDDPESSYGARGGELWVLVDSPSAPVPGTSAEPIGCVGLWPLTRETVELRKMYLAPAARGRGQGKRLARHALERARTLGFERIKLETASVLVEAICLYRSLGFTPSESVHGTCGRAARCDQVWALDLA